ncbi:uncharacterized protein LOC110857796 [Folsomia candida]|uniref:uncharacterized protein LOC110857796 n=1 Tax=Folsomia candida TaxID=158441 RepID=UPI000B8F3E4C|nr:uncharacterized protein LOC110857796 [Folsomia candida]
MSEKMGSSILCALVVVLASLICTCSCAEVGKRTIGILGTVTPSPTHCTLAESGTFVRVEVTGCTAQPCMMSQSMWYEVSTVFMPAWTTNTLHYEIFLTPYKQERRSMSRSAIPGTFTAGRQYQIFGEFQVPATLGLGQAVVEVDLFDFYGRFVRRCFASSIATNVG